MTTQPTDKSNIARIRAQDHIDPQGSVVRSGMLLADAVIAALDAHGDVEISFEGVHGTPSSYYNVFLRRVEEVRAITDINNHIRLNFGSSVQKMIFDRSLESFQHKGPRNPTALATSPGSVASEPLPQDPPSHWTRLLRVFRRGADRR